MKFNKKDEEIMKGLAKTGTMTESNLKKLGYSSSRIKNRSCGEEKLIKNIGRDCKTGEKLYQLTEAGKEQAEKCGISRAEQYRPQGKEKTMNFEHDRKLAEVYCSISREERDSWRTEEQYKREIDEIREHIRQTDPERWEEIKDVKMTALDGGYVNTRGEVCHVEVVTKNYTQEMIDSKTASAEMLGGTYYQHSA